MKSELSELKDQINGAVAAEEFLPCPDIFSSTQADPSVAGVPFPNLAAWRRALGGPEGVSNEQLMKALGLESAQFEARLGHPFAAAAISAVPVAAVETPSSPINFTPQEWAVIALVPECLLNKRMATRLSISLQDLEAVLRDIFDKTGARDRVALKAWVDAYNLHKGAKSEPAVGSLPNRKLPSNVLFTPREREVIALVAQGFNNPEIAETLLIAESTVKKYVCSIHDKTGVKNRFELALYAVFYNLYDGAEPAPAPAPVPGVAPPEAL